MIDNADESMAAGGGADNSPIGADLSGISTPVSGVGIGGGSGDGQAVPLYWYQCKYCLSNFNTNKKLDIHINSHDEFDSNDYSCGNVYSGRKSLWVSLSKFQLTKEKKTNFLCLSLRFIVINTRTLRMCIV